MASREVARAARRFADRGSARLADIPAARLLKATVASVTPGAASDGNALVTVSWRGGEYEVADYPDTYTPGVGDRVRCALDGDNELAILHRCIGYP